MPWLVRDGEVLASVDVADTSRSRRRGLIGRDRIDGALLLRPALAVHTLGMRFPIDVVFLDSEHTVIDVTTMVPGRFGRPRRGARAIIEAEAGFVERHGVRRGDKITVENDEASDV